MPQTPSPPAVHLDGFTTPAIARSPFSANAPMLEANGLFVVIEGQPSDDGLAVRAYDNVVDKDSVTACEIEAVCDEPSAQFLAD